MPHYFTELQKTKDVMQSGLRCDVCRVVFLETIIQAENSFLSSALSICCIVGLLLWHDIGSGEDLLKEVKDAEVQSLVQSGRKQSHR